jgi:hypothetical protein
MSDSALGELLDKFLVRWVPLLSVEQEAKVLSHEDHLRKADGSGAESSGRDRLRGDPDDGTQPSRSLRHFWVLDPSDEYSWKDLRGLASRLAETDTIDVVYPEHRLRLPVNDPSSEPAYNPPDKDDPIQQWVYGYHDGDQSPTKSKSGVNAHSPAVWPVFDGSGIGFFDIERGWFFEHEELEKVPAVEAVADLDDLVAYGVASTEAGPRQHGTQTLGVVLAQWNGLGVAGLAPMAALRGVASYGEPETPDLVGAILAAIDSTDPGDVILLEVETVRRVAADTADDIGEPEPGDMLGGLPVEVDDHHFLAIQLAVALGRVVIEPAGNGNVDGAWDLDAFKKEWEGVWGKSLSRTAADFEDSGAIMVSGCDRETKDGQHAHSADLSYGSRVDCYAWGEYVYSASHVDNSVSYYGHYNGTSSASAIIAGCAILVQQMHLAAYQSVTSPATIRELLSRPTLGTPVVDDSDTILGYMPDLGLIADAVKALPDLYVRDSIDDNGSIPQASVFQSPDILVRAAALTPDEAADLSQGGGLADVLVPNAQITVGESNYLYLRIANRGVVKASGGTATLYWSEAGSLVAPEDWNLIVDTNGEATLPLPDVDGGTGPVVVGPVVWQPGPDEAPETHGCFIAVIDHPVDGAPPLFPSGLAAQPADFETFLDFVGASNNVAWRNFSVLSPPPEATDSTVTLGSADDPAPAWEATERFVIRGARDRARTFHFRIENEVTPPASVIVEVPAAVHGDAVRAGSDLGTDGIPGSGERALVVPGGAKEFSLVLERSTRYPCTLRVRVPAGTGDLPGRIAIVQSYEHREVGRFTWHVAGPDA